LKFICIKKYIHTTRDIETKKKNRSTDQQINRSTTATTTATTTVEEMI